MKTPAFLTAEWRHLVMLNFTVEARVLQPLVPAGTELDFHGGETFVSVVGFDFARTRVCGVRIPFHTRFEEVNLRFYVRRKSPEGWRRGVVFVRELVPRAAIAFVARTCYGEPYSALPMRHRLELDASGIRVQYSWRRAGVWESVSASGAGEPRLVNEGTLEEFITEHYWGYTARRAGVSEYEVEHPRWRVWRATESRLEADVAALYGDRFRESLSVPPASAFIADGSPVIVRLKSSLRAAKPALLPLVRS